MVTLPVQITISCPSYWNSLLWMYCFMGIISFLLLSYPYELNLSYELNSIALSQWWRNWDTEREIERTYINGRSGARPPAPYYAKLFPILCDQLKKWCRPRNKHGKMLKMYCKVRNKISVNMSRNTSTYEKWCMFIHALKCTKIPIK